MRLWMCTQVAASIGPYGAHLNDGSEYTGSYALGPTALTVDALMAFHRTKVSTLASTRADLLAIETIPCIADGVALARLLAEENSGARAWITFTGNAAAHDLIAGGESLAEAVAAVERIAWKQV